MPSHTSVAPSIDVMYAGRVQPFGPRGEPSAIGKLATAGPWRIGVDGLAGDEQADRVHHGGRDKALHHYPQEHYAAWMAEIPALARELATPPAFGENISTLGLTEASVCIGDVYSLGSAKLQISQARQPCWKLNVSFAQADMAMRVQRSLRTGWYYRVLEPGTVEAGSPLRCVDRPQHLWPLIRILDLLYRKPMAIDELRQLAEVPQLAEGWRRLAKRRIASGHVESWSARTQTP